MDRIRLGVVGVATGQLVVLDPCYVGKERPDTFYEMCCEKTMGTDGGGELRFPEGLSGMAVVVNVHGDGLYSVFAEYDNSGELLRIVVEFGEE